MKLKALAESHTLKMAWYLLALSPVNHLAWGSPQYSQCGSPFVVPSSCDHWHKQVTLLECLVFNACLIVPSVFGLVIPLMAVSGML